MAYNKIGADNPYDGINENSTDEEKFNVVFKILKKSHSPEILSHSSLKITHEKIKVFEYEKFGYYNSFKLSPKGILALAEMDFLEYIGYNKNPKLELITPLLKDSVLGYLIANCAIESHASGPTSKVLKELEMDFETFNGIMSQFQRFGFVSDLNLRRDYISFVLHTEAHDYWQKGGFDVLEKIFIDNVTKLSLEVEKLKKDLGSQHLETLSKISNFASAIFSGLSFFKH